MPPKVKFKKEEIVRAAMDIARSKGIDAVTAREVAGALGVSTRPIFTYYSSMDGLKKDLFVEAENEYRAYVEKGLAEELPFLGVWKQYLLFAQTEPELYRLLFLTRPGASSGGAIEAMKFSQELSRESIMRVYHMDARTADNFFRDVWLAAFSFATLIVTGNCPYTTEEMLVVGREISLSVCKAYKEIPGLAEGDYDKNAVFGEIVEK